jgi:hypothetical protein
VWDDMCARKNEDGSTKILDGSSGADATDSCEPWSSGTKRDKGEGGRRVSAARADQLGVCRRPLQGGCRLAQGLRSERSCESRAIGTTWEGERERADAIIGQRFSLSWSRIIPLGGADDAVNPLGIEVGPSPDLVRKG